MVQSIKEQSIKDLDERFLGEHSAVIYRQRIPGIPISRAELAARLGCYHPLEWEIDRP